MLEGFFSLNAVLSDAVHRHWPLGEDDEHKAMDFLAKITLTRSNLHLGNVVCGHKSTTITDIDFGIDFARSPSECGDEDWPDLHEP